MITQEEILRLAKERGACEEGIEWYSNKHPEALLTWEAIERCVFGWVAANIPEAHGYLKTLPEELKEKALVSRERYIRKTMVRIGHRLDVLKDDYDLYVRMAVAKQGYALEQLKDDPDWCVRHAVAQQGYALEQLKDDPDEWVREIAIKKLKEKANAHD